MRVLDLFSGIGGFSLGLERAGMQTVAFCENNDFSRKVLAKHWPGIPIHKSIEELDGRQYRGSIELICGGFPCQPFSVAGQQRGAEDDRALWPEMLRVIREVDPAWVIGENVSGIINMELGNCLSSLEDSGYAVQTFVIPACGVDAPHRRDRVWIIARKNDPGRGNTEERRAESRPGNENAVGHTKYDGSSATEIAGRARKMVSKSKELWENQTNKSPRASRPGNDEDVADSNLDGRKKHDCHEGNSGKRKQTHERECQAVGGGADVADSEGEFSEWSEPEGNRRGEPEISTRNRSSNSSNRGREKEDVADSDHAGDRPSKNETDGDRSKNDKGREIKPQLEPGRLSEAVADSGSEGLQGPEREIVSGEERQSGRYIAECGEDVADPPGSRQQGQGEPEYTGNQEAHGEGKTNPSLDVSVNNERGAQPGVGGVADGVSRWMDEPEGIPRVIGACPDRVGRLKSLGNAVVPQVVEVLGKFIMEIHEEGR